MYSHPEFILCFSNYALSGQKPLSAVQSNVIVTLAIMNFYTGWFDGF
jgi:hypothetical protein